VFLFELDRALVSERRVATLGIIDVFDEARPRADGAGVTERRGGGDPDPSKRGVVPLLGAFKLPLWPTRLLAASRPVQYDRRVPRR
jgi:hypothetical protein